MIKNIFNVSLFISFISPINNKNYCISQKNNITYLPYKIEIDDMIAPIYLLHKYGIFSL